MFKIKNLYMFYLRLTWDLMMSTVKFDLLFIIENKGNPVSKP